MGKQQKARERPFKVNVRQMEKKQMSVECSSDLQTYMACVSRNKKDVDLCHLERFTLEKCLAAAARKPKVLNTLNYHLQRLSKQLKR